MSIDQRVRDALSDLRDLLEGGTDLQAALGEVALAYDLRTDVVLSRAERAFGDLEQIPKAAEVRRSRFEQQIKLDQGINSFYDESPGGDISDYLETKLDRRPTPDEQEYSFHRFMERLLTDMMQTGKFRKNAPNQ